MNYQYRHGSSTMEAARTLWNEGKIRRFYRGVGPALLQGPLARFGDTAANTMVLSYLENSDMPLPVYRHGVPHLGVLEDLLHAHIRHEDHPAS